MFSGIVSGTGRIRAWSGDGAVRRLTIDLGPLGKGLRAGASVCVSGVCLTLVAHRGGRAHFDVVPETLARTYLADLGPGDEVNLERSLRLGDEIGGHPVAGHVDGVGRIVRRREEGDGASIDVRLPRGLAAYVFKKGSIALDGVSLTVAGIRGAVARIALIPETLARTTLGSKGAGARVHVEVDAMARAVVETLRRATRAGIRTRKTATPRTSRSEPPRARPRASRASPE